MTPHKDFEPEIHLVLINIPFKNINWDRKKAGNWEKNCSKWSHIQSSATTLWHMVYLLSQVGYARNFFFFNTVLRNDMK